MALMKWTITRRYRIYSAHRNESAGEKCGRIHGHRYRVRAVFEFTSLNDGIGMLFDDLNAVCEPVIEAFDHHFMVWNEDPLADVLEAMGEPFIRLPFETSTENLAQYFFREIKKSDLPICRIEIEETDSSIVTYTEE